MDWTIEYYNSSLEESILNLPDGLLAKYLRLADLMIEFGPNLGHPHSKHIETGLLELRVKGKEGIARVFYCTVFEKRIVMLHQYIKKTQKIPAKELKIAKKRKSEIENDTRKT